MIIATRDFLFKHFFQEKPETEDMHYCILKYVWQHQFHVEELEGQNFSVVLVRHKRANIDENSSFCKIVQNRACAGMFSSSIRFPTFMTECFTMLNLNQNSLYIAKSKRLEESLDRHEEHNGNLHGIGKKGQVRVNDVMESKENVAKKRAIRQIRCFPGMMRCFNPERQQIQGINQNNGRRGNTNFSYFFLEIPCYFNYHERGSASLGA